MLARVAICDVVGHGKRVSKVSSWLYDSVQSKMNDPDGSSVLSQLNDVAVAEDYGLVDKVHRGLQAGIDRKVAVQIPD